MNIKLKLGISNFKKNKIVYLPYILLVSLSFFLIFSIYNLQSNPTLDQIRGFRSINQLLGIASPIFMFFFFLLIYNVNQFSFKYRTKNFGLYNVLGLDKSDITQVYYIELILVLISGLVIGIPLAIILDYGLYHIFVLILNVSMKLHYHLNIGSLIQSGIIIIGSLLLSTVFTTIQIVKFNPMELLKEESQGEKKPKYNVMIAVFGVALLIFAYWYASSIDVNFLKEENIFTLFISIIFVIIATFILFVSSSLWILNLLKKNTSFYYKSQNMIIVSNLLFRIKKNAFSLAGISILSTMAIFVSAVSSIFVLSLNQESVLPKYDLSIGSAQIIDVHSLSDLNNTDSITYEPIVSVKMKRAMLDEPGLQLLNKNKETELNWVGFDVMNVSQYNKLSDRNISLNADEVLLASSLKFESMDKIESIVMDKAYNVKSTVDVDEIGFPFYRIVIMNDVESVKKDVFFEYSDYYYTQFNLLNGQSRVDDDAYFNAINSFEFFDNYEYGYSFNVLRTDMGERMTLYSGLLFIGFYFVLVFILSLFSLMYFKFFQEAFEDEKRFKSLQQVGLSPDETKSVLNKQISVLFFLPLIVACIHIFFAKNGIVMIQTLFGDTRTSILNVGLIISMLTFILLYLVLYTIIKKLVHKIVVH